MSDRFAICFCMDSLTQAWMLCGALLFFDGDV